jgi:thymidylate kinase
VAALTRTFDMLAESNSGETFVLAVIGVDGSGKTSMLAELQRREVLQGALYVRTEQWQCDHLLRRYHRKAPGGALDFVDGSFARVRPFATAMDILHTYDTRILPWLGHVPYIAVDRYVLSAMAYFAAMGHRDVMHDYFADVRRADLTIYLRADMETLLRRYRDRGVHRDDEAPELIRRHAAALDELVGETDWNVVTIDNVRPFAETYLEVENAVRDALGVWRARTLVPASQ